MNSARDRALQIESEFFAGVLTNLDGAIQSGGRALRGRRFERSEDEDSGPIRAALIDRELYDRDMEREFPGRRTVVCRGFERRLFFFSREASRTLAAVIAPPGPLIDGESPPPIDLATLKDFVRKRVRSSRRTRTTIAVCSPSGFDEEVWNTRWDQSGVRVVLVAPRDDENGWRVAPLWGNADERLVRLFDPEGMADKFRRIRAELDERSGDLLTGGVSARSLAEGLELPLHMVEQALYWVARADPELRASRRAGDVLVYRGAPVEAGQEVRSMSISERVRSLFSSSGDEPRKINELSERRAALSQRRDRIYDDISKLESKEGQLTEEGRRNTSKVVRRRLAAQVAQFRRDIQRANTTAAMLNQQINVISTHIHNLTLIQQGQMAKLPSAEELTEDAVRAEEMLETLQADAALVTEMETGTAETMLGTDESAILKEFEAADAPAAAPVAEAPPVDIGRAEPTIAEPPAAEPASEPAEPKSRRERSGPAAEAPGME
ncbi:MAG: hypothetical protein V3T70_06320 [Phycisphaerae bacterium]